MSDDEGILELPYRAEYAKSGRSTCKGCKTSIAKDVLRLAVMVQSPVYDGKVPNWYHCMCFFGKQRPKTVGDIQHFGALRWEDQEKIRESIATATGAGAPEPKGKEKKSKKRPAQNGKNSLLKDFKIEYAKSSRAACKGCEDKLAKGEVRISKKDYETDNAKRFGGMDRWHHIECFAKLRDELEFFECGDQLPGFGELKAEDQVAVTTALPKKDKNGVDVKDEPDGPPDEKKIKLEKGAEKSDDKEIEAMKKQNKQMFKYRDALKALKTTELTMMLEFNNQSDAVGTERKLDRVSDIMTFGALEPCPTCKDGQLVFRDGLGYQCSGNLTEWSKCTYVDKKPQRIKCKIPDGLLEKYSFLDKYKCKVHDRLLPKVEPSVKSEPSGSGTKVERFAPLRGMSFYVIGKTKLSRDELKVKITKLGGKLESKLNKDVAAVISTESQVEKMNDKMEEVKDLDIQVVPESFIDACQDGNAIDKIKELSISPWGSDPKVRVDSFLAKSMSKPKSQFEKKSSSKVTLKVKGGSAVDPDSNLDSVAHVFKDKAGVWNAILNKTNVQTNKNSYYKLQILKSDKTSECWVFRAWGRIGTTIGGHKLDPYRNINDAKKDFAAAYFDHTGNNWEERERFVKQPNLYYPVDIDYGDDAVSLHTESSIPSKLSKAVQDLVTMLFDVDTMKKVMMEFELDLEKMPLGKLSKNQIRKAYGVLSELQMKDGDIKPAVVIDATNKFYTLIPHDFGIDSPPLLNNKEIIQTKLEMLESLMEMEVAYSLLKETKGEGDDELHPIDAHYKKLNSDITVLEKDSDEFQTILTYVKNTHAATHSNYTLDVSEVFKVKRSGEERRFKPFAKLNNKKLLWHGSRLTNFAGILSQGLRIAPPEAPVTGYMFGKGVYFADMVSKSANYCMTSSVNPNGLLLLCQVALGEMYERTKADYIEKLPPGKHSCKGVGATCPDPAGSKITPEGVEIPYGKPISGLDRSQTSLLYNEYIVYDVAQVKAQYLVKTKFNYKH
ncbi:hypothetical protein GE061_004509 [Apolygus lucorum]|uniref:Poly [ADP-ribose] polymerase n=1 Tax=Apolygus lucorum TaxID=248454 RepID=A0A8S9X1C2_APOLU|nr:hypothetical protein GE061_004509 [Apolygus lucorum]